MQYFKQLSRLLLPLACIVFLSGAGLFKSDVKKGGGGQMAAAGFVTAINVEFRAGPSNKAPSLATLYEGTSIIPTGIKNGSWWEIEALGKTGWVRSDNITR